MTPSTRRFTFLTDCPLSGNASRHAGGILLLLDALLLFAMWPIVGLFVVATVVCGLIASAMLRSWNDVHPTTQEDRSWSPSNLPEINIGAVRVGGDIGGFFFLCATVLAIVLGLPSVRWFVAGSLACAAIAAALMVRARRGHVYTREAMHIWR